MTATTTQAGSSTAPLNAKPWVVLMVVLSATFMQLLDVSIVNVATPSIQSTLHAAYADVQLVLAGYQLGFACFLITAARLGDMFGRRRLFLIGMFAFTAASIACGTASTIEFLIAARVVQGMSSALMFSQVLAIIQVVFPPEKRGGAFGAYGAVIGLGTILGPLTGGLLIQADLFADPWRAIFLVNVPIGVIAFLAALRLLPESKAPERPRLDVPGVALSAGGLALVIYGLSEGRTRGWPLWLDLGLGIGVGLLALFTWHEARLTRLGGSPLLDTVLFRDRAFRVGSLLNILFYMGVPAFFFVFNVYLQAGEGFSALRSGLATFAFALGATVTSANSDGIAKRLGNRVLLLGSGLLAVGMLSLVATIHLAGASPGVIEFVPAMLLSGLGFGLFVPPVIDLVLANVQRERAGAASGALATSQQVGGAIGVALIGVLFFTLVGRNAAPAALHEQPGLQARLSAAGLPEGAISDAAQTFQRCFVTQSRAKDPTVTPPGCEVAAGNPAAGAAFGTAATSASARAFARSIQEALLYEVAVFLLALLLALRLPRVEPATLDLTPSGG